MSIDLNIEKNHSYLSDLNDLLLFLYSHNRGAYQNVTIKFVYLRQKKLMDLLIKI